MNKKIKEMDTSGQAGRNFKVDVDDISKVQSSLKSLAEPGDSVQLVDEALKMSVYPILNALGIDITNKTPEEKQGIKSMIKQFVAALNDKGVTNLVLREDEDDLPEIPDKEKMERGDEYGIRVSESLDKKMNKLKEDNAPTIKLSEGINPRIKKSDLIKYLKNRK
jgi:hypothetical protein